MIGRLLLALLVLAASAGILAENPLRVGGMAAATALLQLLPGLVPGRRRGPMIAFAVLALAAADHLLVLLLLPVALRSLRRPRAARALRTGRDLLVLAVATLALRQTPAALAGAVATTLLLVVLLPRLEALRMAEFERRAVPAAPGANWAVPAVAVTAAFLFWALPPAFEFAGRGREAPSALGRRRPGGAEPRGEGSGPGQAVAGARRISIGDIGRLQRDLRPLLEVTVIRGGRAGPAEEFGPLFRSGALEEFDGTTWESREGRAVPLRAPSGGYYPLPRRRLPKGEAIEQRLRFLTGGSDALFCLGMPTAVGGDGAKAGLLLVPRGEVRAAESYPDGAAYAIRSVAVPGEYAPVDDEDLSPARRARLLALPPDHDRAAALARTEVAGGSTGLTGRGLLARVESFLGRRCRYSLDIPPAADATPVEAFLFDSRRGHCELFASAAAVILRSLGVPARVVIGFRGGLYDAREARYTLRGADAHAWTEAWFEETGWVTFDPTPATEAERPDAAGGAEDGDGTAAGAAGFFDRILAFDGADRRRLAEECGAFLERLARNTFTARDGSFLYAVPAVILVSLLALLLLVRRRRTPPVPPAPAPPAPVPVPEAWTLLLARLSSLGIRRAATETGLELAGRAAASGVTPRESLDRLAAAYAAERFGALPPSEAERAALRALAEGIAPRAG